MKQELESSPVYDLTGQIIGCAMSVHRVLGSGFCESVYQQALIHELGLANISCSEEQKIKVQYKDKEVGYFSADLVIDQKLIIELKAVQNIVPAHEVQLVNYLTATHIDEGLLLNFGATSLQFKKKHRKHTIRNNNSAPPNLQN